MIFLKIKNNKIIKFNRLPLIRLSFFISLIIVVSSCKSTYNNSYYFKSLQRDTSIEKYISENIEPKIRKGDQLSISVSSLNPLDDALFNSTSAGGERSSGSNSNSGSSSGGVGVSSSGYFIGNDGSIVFHKLGTIPVEGLTLKELENSLQEKLSPYLKDVVVRTAILNHHITILGEVNHSQVIQLPQDDKLSILDALAACGDITYYGDKTNLLVIRNTEKGKEIKHINLENHAVINSPWYYLKPDDVLYVVGNNIKREEYDRTNLQSKLGVISILVTFGLIILNRIK